jgi:hypothetical protein
MPLWGMAAHDDVRKFPLRADQINQHSDYSA